MSSSSTVTVPRRRSRPMWSLRGMAAAGLLADLVQELVHGPTDALEPPGLRDRHLRVGHVPGIRGDLVAGEVVLRLRTADPRPALKTAVQDVQVIGNLRREVVDVGVPLAVEGGAEEQSG